MVVQVAVGTTLVFIRAVILQKLITNTTSKASRMPSRPHRADDPPDDGTAASTTNQAALALNSRQRRQLVLLSPRLSPARRTRDRNLRCVVNATDRNRRNLRCAAVPSVDSDPRRRGCVAGGDHNDRTLIFRFAICVCREGDLGDCGAGCLRRLPLLSGHRTVDTWRSGRKDSIGSNGHLSGRSGKLREGK